MINEVMYGLGSKSSVIRELFSYGLERKKVVGADKVYDFSLGNPSIPAPHQVKDAIAKGCSEVDVVINIGHVKNGDFDKVEAEIKALKEAAGDKIPKVIIETCYLTDDEKVKLCQCVTNAKADYIKTSTGFGTGGATIEDIRLFAQNIGSDVKMKAAGGVKSREDLEIFLEAGCDRIGTSSAVKMLEEN